MPTREYKERLVSGTAIVESIAPKKDAVIDKPRTFRRLCAFRVFIVLQKPVHFQALAASTVLLGVVQRSSALWCCSCCV